MNFYSICDPFFSYWIYSMRLKWSSLERWVIMILSHFSCLKLVENFIVLDCKWGKIGEKILLFWRLEYLVIWDAFIFLDFSRISLVWMSTSFFLSICLRAVFVLHNSNEAFLKDGELLLHHHEIPSQWIQRVRLQILNINIVVG